MTKTRSICASKTEGVTLDHAAGLYDILSPMMMLGAERRLHREVLSCLGLHNATSVLDIGCGTGTLTKDIFEAMSADRARWVVGIDAAEEMIRKANRKYTDRKGLQFDAVLAEDLPYPADTFDRIVSTFFFHHLNYKLKKSVMSEMWRTMRPGGTAIILDVDIPYSLWGRLCAYSGYWLFEQNEIKENIDGKLRTALMESEFAGNWDILSRRSGYLSIFELRKTIKGES